MNMVSPPRGVEVSQPAPCWVPPLLNAFSAPASSRGPPPPTPESPLTSSPFRSQLPFPPFLSLHFNIITNPSVIQIVSIIQFLLPSAGSGFLVAEQEKAKRL